MDEVRKDRTRLFSECFHVGFVAARSARMLLVERLEGLVFCLKG